jgi:hypothetical protein
VTRTQVGLATSATGVIAFFGGMYGLTEEWSPYVSGVGTLAVVVGLVIALFTTKLASLSRPHLLVVIVGALALVLHLYENLYQSPGEFSFGWLLWGFTPYAICLPISSFPATRVAAVAGAVVALLFDLVTHYDVFANPNGSTAALALIFIPLWSTLVLSPAAVFVAWLILRRRDRPVQPTP